MNLTKQYLPSMFWFVACGVVRHECCMVWPRLGACLFTYGQAQGRGICSRVWAVNSLCPVSFSLLCIWCEQIREQSGWEFGVERDVAWREWWRLALAPSPAYCSRFTVRITTAYWQQFLTIFCLKNLTLFTCGTRQCQCVVLYFIPSEDMRRCFLCNV